MPSPDPSETRLILPPDGRQTRIDFFHSRQKPGSKKHITFARTGPAEWWRAVASWFTHQGASQKELLQSFGEMLSEKGYSKKTRQSYLFMLRKFFGFFEGRDPSALTMGDIEDYNFEFFVSGRYSRSYQLQFINALKLFYQFTFNKELNLKNLRKSEGRRS
ncbi:MAG: phage integrase N-terminal SAM-like domain-containing protein [Bacteroidales bacterium]|nr:phage integrase N-terminal SAM-like domain-containing protein [Bacteroidales bacterium]